MIEVDREVSHCVKNMKAVVSTNLKNKQKMPTVILRGADNIKSKYDKLLKVSTLNVCIECSVFRILQYCVRVLPYPIYTVFSIPLPSSRSLLSLGIRLELTLIMF